MSILLASGSPQRRAIMAQLELPFRVVVPEVDEHGSGNPDEVALHNAQLKANAARVHARPGEVIVACDTLLDVDGEVWGKPADAGDAERMLLALAGREHVVIGGACVLDLRGDEPRALVEFVARTRVRFRAVSEQWLHGYLQGGEWEGRAGGYAIQGTGAALIAGIDGDYLNVVGFPVASFLDALDASPGLDARVRAPAPDPTRS